MSAEYFCIEEVQNGSKSYTEYAPEPVQFAEKVQTKDSSDCGSASTKKSQQGERLHEIEEQLQLAENRCNTLKGQLDFMKKVYHKASDQQPEIRHRSDDRSSANTKTPDNSSQKTLCQYGLSHHPKTSSTPSSKSGNNHHSISPSRHLSHISTDTTGAAVRTINNILTGITDSVNRLSELHVHIGTDCRRRTPEPIIGVEVVNFKQKGGHGEHFSKISNEGPAEVSDPSIVEEISYKESDMYSTKSKINPKKKSRFKPNKPTAIVKTSASSVNTVKRNVRVTARHVEKKHTINPVRIGMLDLENTPKKQLKKSKPISRTLLRKKIGEGVVKSFRQFTTENLVELYHNNAAKSSDSEESTHINDKLGSVQHRADEVPPLKIDVSVHSRKEEGFKKKSLANTVPMIKDSNYLTPIVENDYTEPAAPRADINNSCTLYPRNYELPTISSKMKQVAKCYLHSFNFKSIPFCAAKSTTPSHNIGINIQQVMSIIKTRQPLQGISPTLAHNIGLAAEKLHNRPLTTLASSISSRIYNRTTCPLIRNTVNFQQLQEMAKEIVEEDEACVGDNQDNADASNSIMLRGPSGDADVKDDKTQTIWTTDPTKNKNCTCIGQNGIGFQQVLSKYHSNHNSSTAVYTGSHIHYGMPPLKQYRMSKRQFLQPLRNKSQMSQKPVTAILAAPDTDTCTMQQIDTMPLKGREKTLKEVLNNLHNDFEALNTKYEELSTQAREGTIETNEETLKQLEEMETNLNNKEEEIKMVMALYKEVLALKQQVKILKERTSQVSVPVKEQVSRFKEYKDPSAAMHLTKLLRQIQNYQMNIYKR